jgi:predicted adenylyl cyclase CyaB
MEIEIRSFIDQEKFKELMVYFSQNAKFLNVKNQETYYFDSKADVRLQRWDDGAKIWYKGGKMHEEAREEIEVRFKKNDFDNMLKIFEAIGLKTNIKWYRIRHSYDWKDIKVFMDYTIGYGYIIELEEQGEEKEKEEILCKLKKELKALGVELTSKEQFDKRYEFYEKNWRQLIEN